MKEHSLDLEKLREAQRMLSTQTVSGPLYMYFEREKSLRQFLAEFDVLGDEADYVVQRWKDNEMGSVYLRERE